MIHTRVSNVVASTTRRRRLVVGLAGAILVMTFGWAHFKCTKSIICVDGKRVVCVGSENAAQDVLQQIKSSSGCDPAEVEFRQNVVVARAPRDAEPVSRHKAMTIVRTVVSPVVCRWSIIVDGKPTVAVPDRKTAGEVLDLAKLKFGQLAENLAEEPQFKENVKVDMAAISPGIFCDTAEEALALLFEKPAPKIEDAVYVVKNGDVACVIASRHGLTLKALERMNPGMNLARLHIGDKLRMKAAREVPPKLTVIVRDLALRVESTPPPVRRVSSAQLYTGKTTLISPGQRGKRKVRAADVYENGRKVGAEVIEEEILEPSSPRIIAVGIKPRPTWK